LGGLELTRWVEFFKVKVQLIRDALKGPIVEQVRVARFSNDPVDPFVYCIGVPWEPAVKEELNLKPGTHQYASVLARPNNIHACISSRRFYSRLPRR